MRFRLLRGSHDEPGGKRYTAGDVFESQIDLVAAFGAEKFERVGDDTPATATSKDEAPSDTSSLGIDVTSEFSEAGENGLLVFRKGRSYHVADAESPDAALNEKGLNKAAVIPFVDNYLDS